jgi:hypothetical protein
MTGLDMTRRAPSVRTATAPASWASPRPATLYLPARSPKVDGVKLLLGAYLSVVGFLLLLWVLVQGGWASVHGAMACGAVAGILAIIVRATSSRGEG